MQKILKNQEKKIITGMLNMCKLTHININVSDHIFINVLTMHWELKHYTHRHTHGIIYFLIFALLTQ